MRWKTAHARRRRANLALVKFQQAVDLYHMMAAYALMDAIVGTFVKRLVGEVVAMQQFMGVPAGGVVPMDRVPIIGEQPSEFVLPLGHRALSNRG